MTKTLNDLEREYYLAALNGDLPGGSGVQSVTGSNVDNTDPLNPVVQGMPEAPTTSAFVATGTDWLDTRQGANNLYEWSTDTTATDPGDGVLKGNNAMLDMVTELYISTDAMFGVNNQGLFSRAEKLDALVVLDPLDSTTNAIFLIEDFGVDNGGWFTFKVTTEDASPLSFDDGDPLRLIAIASSSRISTVRSDTLAITASTTNTQNPTGEGPANAIKVNFGAPFTGPKLDFDGTQFTFKESMLVDVTYYSQPFLPANETRVVLLERVVFNGAQLGPTRVDDLDADEQSDVVVSKYTRFRVNVEPGDTLCFEVMRDSKGANAGGLRGGVRTSTTGAWDADPSAWVAISQLVQGPLT